MPTEVAPRASSGDEQAFLHWRVTREDGNLARLVLDRADSSTNTLSAEVIDEFVRALDLLDRNPPAGLIVASGKANGFIAGADVAEFAELESEADAIALVRRGWNAFERLATVAYPTVALIRGFCLGGGLELAMACRYRVVVDDPATRLGLPEVMLGIVPGWGGMKRLPRLVGAPAALDLLLTGKTIDAHKAKKLGLADECVPPRIMENAARGVLLSKPTPRQLPFPLSLTLHPLARRFIADKARRQVEKRARREHYPSPYAILEVWQRYDGDVLAVPAQDPASLGSLVRSPTTRNLIRVFHLQERLKSAGKGSDFVPKHVHVVGGGTMGGDIAAWCALRGLRVTIQDQDVQRLAPAMGRAAKLFRERLKDPRRARDALDRLIPDVRGDGVRQADVIIEAIFEDLGAKQTLFATLERHARADAILATNTSSIPIEAIAAGLRDPSRLVGIHFFNPVPRMMLVEIVIGAATNEQVAMKAAAFVRAIDKLPLSVRSAPGFLVNRILAPYLMAAMRCVDEGIAPEEVDEAALAFGMPVGPIELADTVGLDICMAVGRMLGAGTAPPRRLSELVSSGSLGKKSKRGFYDWPNGKAVKASRSGPAREGLADRLVMPMVQEARRALDEHVVTDADLVDAGAIFGTGFAPFRGGPLRYAASLGS
ncbi:MAG: 3-hydroxyacyl-CoA dehydrogenase NAD-binding domain-containing protein [Pseudomonadota bacterium]|nr:3-hydroxyacyl-CoA dehydrogenase NAD-binding domain-containing protein [Pseudomonadota bacterium]